MIPPGEPHRKPAPIGRRPTDADGLPMTLFGLPVYLPPDADPVAAIEGEAMMDDDDREAPGGTDFHCPGCGFAAHLDVLIAQARAEIEARLRAEADAFVRAEPQFGWNPAIPHDRRGWWNFCAFGTRLGVIYFRAVRRSRMRCAGCGRRGTRWGGVPAEILAYDPGFPLTKAYCSDCSPPGPAPPRGGLPPRWVK